MADSEFDGLTKAAKGNYIRLKPEAAKKCVELCGDMIDELNSAIGDADKLAEVKGFGDGAGDAVPNAKHLADRYKSRVDGGDSSLKHVLTKHRDLVNDMMETFIAAGRAYWLNEKHTSEDLANYDKAIDGYRPKKP
ncbi:hypothetical protein [Nocardia mexicana]|uniref:Excreted virulence factor EspC (Type VII ESX diderm) n=1 Tax=Nocardia mexicana TaxID=279262 RepID=A0A370GQW8_9NOCA|nr:hypothetical protein [Nocardia mexicana]RDI46115.1 hypothetical protein DFR68_11216 [Nocardia mexicana]